MSAQKSLKWPQKRSYSKGHKKTPTPSKKSLTLKEIPCPIEVPRRNDIKSPGSVNQRFGSTQDSPSSETLHPVVQLVTTHLDSRHWTISAPRIIEQSRPVEFLPMKGNTQPPPVKIPSVKLSSVLKYVQIFPTWIECCGYINALIRFRAFKTSTWLLANRA